MSNVHSTKDSKPIKIILGPITSQRNIGDMAKEISAIKLLKEAFVGCQIFCLTYFASEEIRTNKEVFRQLTDMNCTILPSLLPLLSMRGPNGEARDASLSLWKTGLSIVRGFILLAGCKLLRDKAILLLSDRLEKESLTAFISADLVFLLGSDRLLCVKPGVKGLINSIIASYDLLLSRVFSRKTVLFGLSIGPFAGTSRLFARIVLSRVQKIFLRDLNSHQFLKDIGISPSLVTVFPDLAFNLAENNVNAFTFNNKKPKVAVIITSPLPTALNWMKDPQGYLGRVAEVCDYLINSKGAQIYLVPFSTKVPNDDTVGLKEVWRLMERKDSVELLPYNPSPFYCKQLLESMDLVISSRVHGSILANNLVIAIPVVYDYRLAGIMRLLDLEEFCIQVNNEFNIAKVLSIIDYAWIGRVERKAFVNASLKKQKERFNEYIYQLQALKEK